MLLTLPYSGVQNETQRLTKGVRLTIAIGKWYCGPNTHDVRTEIVKDAFHLAETLPTSCLPSHLSSSAPAEQKANTYLVEWCSTSIGKRHDHIAVASCCASFLDEVCRNVAKFTFPGLHPCEALDTCVGEWMMVASI